jgi:hypothetical protein
VKGTPALNAKSEPGPRQLPVVDITSELYDKNEPVPTYIFFAALKIKS